MPPRLRRRETTLDKCTLNKDEWKSVADSVGYVLEIIASKASQESLPEVREAYTMLQADLMAAMSACFYVGTCAADKVIFAAVPGSTKDAG